MRLQSTLSLSPNIKVISTAGVKKKLGGSCRHLASFFLYQIWYKDWKLRAPAFDKRENLKKGNGITEISQWKTSPNNQNFYLFFNTNEREACVCVWLPLARWRDPLTPMNRSLMNTTPTVVVGPHPTAKKKLKIYFKGEEHPSSSVVIPFFQIFFYSKMFMIRPISNGPSNQFQVWNTVVCCREQ